MLYARRNPPFYILFYKTLQFKRTWRHIQQIDSYIPLGKRFHYVHFTTDIRILSAQCIAWDSRIPRKRFQGKFKKTKPKIFSRFALFDPFHSMSEFYINLRMRMARSASVVVCFLAFPCPPSVPWYRKFPFYGSSDKRMKFPFNTHDTSHGNEEAKGRNKSEIQFYFLTKLKFIGWAKWNTWEAFHWFFEKIDEGSLRKRHDARKIQ